MKIYPLLPNQKPHKERQKEIVLELPVPHYQETYEETTAPTGSDRGVCIIDTNEDMMDDVIII